MPTVTRLVLADRRGSKTSVEIDGEPWVELVTEVVLQRGLAKGQSLEASDLDALLDADAFIRARRATARLLQARPRAMAELKRLLEERRFSAAIAERTVAHFLATGDLDDAAFARKFARHQLKTRKTGPLRVRFQLRQLGVASDLIDAALEEEPAAQTESQETVIVRFIEQRLRRVGPDDPRRRAKIFAALVRAGFEPDTFATLLDEALGKS
jgi:regulatory protein